MAKNITWIEGDATAPVDDGAGAVLPHVCNDIGKWGSGYVLAISKRWSAPEAAYRDLAYDQRTLGKVQFVPVNGDTVVANMIAQEGVGHVMGRPPIRYGALAQCLEQVNEYCKESGANVHMPRIGSDRAGGRWEIIEQLIRECLWDVKEIYVYDLGPKQR